ncbi:hypothetical protein Esti_004841 [Eimeria stiedai]
MSARSLIPSPASSFDGCLLLQALNDALSRLSAAAFIRKEVAQKLFIIARQELARALVQRSGSLPCLVMASQLQVYRHFSIGPPTAAAAAEDSNNNTWLFVLRDPLIAIIPSSSSSSSGAAKGKGAQHQGEVLLQELKQQLLQMQQEQQQLLLHAADEEDPELLALESEFGGDAVPGLSSSSSMRGGRPCRLQPAIAAAAAGGGVSFRGAREQQHTCFEGVELIRHRGFVRGWLQHKNALANAVEQQQQQRSRLEEKKRKIGVS